LLGTWLLLGEIYTLQAAVVKARLIDKKINTAKVLSKKRYR
jgi:hypothetical protein